jgi:hypothetical protein
MIERAKEEGFFDEEEARQGVRIGRVTLPDAKDELEAVDAEGNVVAGEKILVSENGDQSEAKALVGSLARFLGKGMPVEEALSELGWDSPGANSKKGQRTKDKGQDKNSSSPSDVPSHSHAIHIHTIQLPARAPKQLLLELKTVFDRFPGKERIQFRIGEQDIPLPMAITMSTILEKKIEEVMRRYSGATIDN